MTPPLVPCDFNNRQERRTYFAELGRFCQGRHAAGLLAPPLDALHERWRHDRALLHRLARRC
jgi:hypothetical protein